MRVLVLRQIDSIREITNDEVLLRSYVSKPGVAGASIRYPGNFANPTPGDWSPFHAATDVASRIAGDKELQLRGMSGLWTPAHGMGHSFIYDGKGADGTVDEGFGAGKRVPLPFGPDGGFNEPHLAWMAKFRQRLINRTRKRGDKVIHAMWPGLTWAEIAYIEQMTTQPGYSHERVIETHLRLMREWLAMLRPDEQLEFALSGHVAQRFGSLFTAVTNEARKDRRYVLSRNDWREDVRTDFMTWPPNRAAQMLDVDTRQANGTEHNWARLLDLCEDAASGRGVEWFEAYDPQFAAPAFLAEIERRYA